MKLEGRKILVTGAASGLGRAIAHRLADEGALLALLDLHKAALEEVEKAIPGSVALACDVTDHAGTGQCVGQLIDRLGGLDGLVNSAGIDMIKSFSAMSIDDWKRVIDVNLTGTMSVCHAALSALRESRDASIVNIASGAGLRPVHDRTAYSASKAGVIMFSKALAFELGSENIRVNVICPGAIDTPMLQGGIEAATDSAAMREAVRSRVVLGRIGDPSQIAAAVSYLLSPDSSFVTGSTLAIDGGRVFH